MHTANFVGKKFSNILKVSSPVECVCVTEKSLGKPVILFELPNENA